MSVCKTGSKKKTFELSQGSNEPMYIRLTKNGKILNLDDVTALSFCFKNADGSTLTKDLTSGVTKESAPDGIAKVDIPIAERLLLKVGSRQDFGAIVTLGLEVRDIKFSDCLDVTKAAC